MMSRKCYDRIGTLEKLRCERRRVDAELRRMGHRLAEDRKEIAGLFTPVGMFTYLGGGVDRICSAVQWCLSGYDFVRDLIDRIRTERRHATKNKA